MANADAHLVLACLPLLWQRLRHIPLDSAAAKPLWIGTRYCRLADSATLYDLLIFSLLNTCATIRGALVGAQRRDWALSCSWIPPVVWCNTEHFHEDFAFMWKYCNGLILNWAAYWFANNRPEVLRSYLATGHFRICAPCIEKWHLESVLAGVVQTGSAPCVLETGMRGLLYAT
jgi:hypothetical protein